MSKQHAEYVDHMGDDMSVVNAARVSFDKVSVMYSDQANQALIGYLARGCTLKDFNNLVNIIREGTDDTMIAEQIIHDIAHTATHWTPFAHTAISLRMAAPLPIRTQCFKHKVGMVENEESRRYISSRPELFIPDTIRSKPIGSIKQGSGTAHPDADHWLDVYKHSCNDMITLYEQMIEAGVCPEQARFVLPQGVLVNWIWTGNLVSFANFYNKRSDPHAQVEIQQLAEQVKSIVQPLFPISWQALTTA